MATSSGRRALYQGAVRRMAVAIDIGTTYTAASFCILQPGREPKFEEVLRWPKQATPDAKVPSVLFYDGDGDVCAFGAEVEDDETLDEAEAQGWYKAEWWKLHLRPPHLSTIENLQLPALPPHTSVDAVVASFLSYVKLQLQGYIVAQYGEGAKIWDALSPAMTVVLTTPNGWEGTQQARMRQAAIKAGLVDEEGGRRVKFVTEAEAAVLYAVDSGCIGDWLVKDGQVILCDCGGGTVDITGYTITDVNPLKLEESAASRCYLAGAVFVNQQAKAYLKRVLAGTEWDNDDALQRAVNHFDRIAKKKFDGPGTAAWIELGGFKSIPAKGIARGRLKIPGEDVAKFFDPCVAAIKSGLQAAFEDGNQRADKIILVGGLSASPYVYAELLQWGEGQGISVSRPDGPMSKAVANGALAWHIDASVTARFSKCHYGTDCNVLPDSADASQKGRERHQLLDGTWMVPGAWSEILGKNTKVDAGKEFTETYRITMADNSFTRMFACTTTCKIYAYRRASPPKFITFPGKTDKLFPGFELLCSVKADLSGPFSAAPSQYSQVKQSNCKTLHLDICLALGETELTARIRWMEDGVQRHGPATVVYE